MPDSHAPHARPNGRLRRWIGAALVGYFCLIFTATHIPLKAEAYPGHADKLVHFAMYAGLSFLLSAWFAAGGKGGIGLVVLTFGITAVYGVVDELLQIVVDRTADPYDWLADCAGSLVGLSAMGLVRRICFRYLTDGES